MSGLLVVVTVLLAWVTKQVFGSLLAQQVRGSVPDYAARRARAAAKFLPADLAGEYLDNWLAELHALEAKPLSSIRYAHGLQRAARSITALAGAPVPFKRRELAATRAADISMSLFVLLVMFPLMLCVTLALRISGRATAFRREEHLGRGGTFWLLTFETRTANPATPDAVGKFLELTSIEHMPRMLNVLRGDMAIIGPVPHPTVDGRVSAVDGRPASPVRPGMVCWQTVAATDAAKITMGEARLRDEVRGFRNDAKLLLLVVFLGMRLSRSS